jgi:hypothetical protein
MPISDLGWDDGEMVKAFQPSTKSNGTDAPEYTAIVASQQAHSILLRATTTTKTSSTESLAPAVMTTPLFGFLSHGSLRDVQKRRRNNLRYRYRYAVLWAQVRLGRACVSQSCSGLWVGRPLPFVVAICHVSVVATHWSMKSSQHYDMVSLERAVALSPSNHHSCRSSPPLGARVTVPTETRFIHEQSYGAGIHP